MSLGDLFSNDAAQKAAGYQIGGLQKGRVQAYKQIDKGQADYTGQSDKALGYYDQLDQTGTSANRTYADALGLNGADAAAAARSSYTQTPGYDFQMEQGLQALDRQRAAAGSLASGGASADAMRYAMGQADADYNSWLDRLGGLNDQYGQTTGARAAITTTLGDRLYGTGMAKGQIGWNTETGIGSALAEQEMNKYNVGGNQLGAIMGGASLGARLLGFGG